MDYAIVDAMFTTRFHSAMKYFIVPILLLTLCCSNSWATSYDFLEESSGDILATLHTDGTNPFDHTNVTGLSFTSEGDDLLGFGVGTYLGMFDSTFAGNRWTSDGVGGLTTEDEVAEGIFWDVSPPHSTVLVDASTLIFSLRVDTSSFGSMELVDGTLPDFVRVQGGWQQVPEPSTLLLMTLGTAGLLGVRRRRRA